MIFPKPYFDFEGVMFVVGSVVSGILYKACPYFIGKIQFLGAFIISFIGIFVSPGAYIIGGEDDRKRKD